MITIGDFVTAYSSGYWQVIDIKPKIADENYNGKNGKWKKGDVIGKWIILKKAFTPKMKPRIDYTFEDSGWIRPVSSEILAEITQYFDDHPDYKVKFESAQVKLRPMITNCWFDFPEEEEDEFNTFLSTLPSSYTLDEFWKIAKKYKKYATNPPAKYLLNFLTYPWNQDKEGNLIYHGCELTK